MRKRLPPHLFFLLLLLVSNSVLSQQPEYIIGKLIDSKTQEPIPFASIRIKDRALGIISNTDGSFKIPLKYKEYGDIIEISSMGYQTKEILIHNFSVYELNDVRLLPALFELEETIVRGEKKRRLSANQIVQRAIANIPKNYPQNLFSTVGYYRDYQLKANEYVNLNEAIVEVFDSGFSKIDSTTTLVQIYDYEKNLDFERDTLSDDPYDYKRSRKIVDNAFLQKYGGNEFSILRVHDAVRNFKVNSYSFVNRFDIDLLQNHIFTRDNSTYINGEAVYAITFRKKYLNKFGKGAPKYSAFGVLYISQGDFAIHKMEYVVYDERKRKSKGTLNRHNGRGQLLFEVITEYRRNKNKMYLNYISFHNSFILWEPPKFKIDDILIDLKYGENVLRSNGSFKVLYNRTPREEEAVKPENYRVRFNGKRLKLRNVVVFENMVSLFPDMDRKEKNEMLAQLTENVENPIALNKILSIDVEPIHDIDGNVLNKWEKRDYIQFREYFVQQVKPHPHLPAQGKFMNRRKPIFEDQPVVRPGNFDDYWMNTPLQNIKTKGTSSDN